MMLTIILILLALFLILLLISGGAFLYIKKLAEKDPEKAMNLISKVPGLNSFVSKRINKMVTNDPNLLDEHLQGNPHAEQIKEVLSSLTPEETMQVLNDPSALNQKVQATLSPVNQASKTAVRRKPNRNKNKQSRQSRKKNRR